MSEINDVTIFIGDLLCFKEFPKDLMKVVELKPNTRATQKGKDCIIVVEDNYGETHEYSIKDMLHKFSCKELFNPIEIKEVLRADGTLFKVGDIIRHCNGNLYKLAKFGYNLSDYNPAIGNIIISTICIPIGKSITDKGIEESIVMTRIEPLKELLSRYEDDWKFQPFDMEGIYEENHARRYHNPIYLDRKHAIRLHREMWNEIADYAESGVFFTKEDFMKKYGFSNIENDCFCCEYTKFSCKDCPIKWKSQEDFVPCEYLHKPYELEISENSLNFTRIALIARQMASLEERRVDL